MDKKKTGWKLQLACLLALAVAVVPFAVYAAQKRAPGIGGNRTGLHKNLSFYGVSVYRVSSADVSKTLIDSGDGFLDMICTLGADAAVAGYALALDDATGGFNLTVDSLSLAISPQVYVSLGTATAAASACGANCWCPMSPIPFEDGLAGANSTTGYDSLYYVHSSSGVNPGI